MRHPASGDSIIRFKSLKEADRDASAREFKVWYEDGRIPTDRGIWDSGSGWEIDGIGDVQEQFILEDKDEEEKVQLDCANGVAVYQRDNAGVYQLIEKECSADEAKIRELYGTYDYGDDED